MTTPERLVPLIMRLYPAAYRAEHHAEITSTAYDALALRGRAGATRELADLAVHALRQRVGLSATSHAGALAATAAPLAAASAIALSGVFLLLAERALVVPDGPYISPDYDTDLYTGRFGPFNTLGPIAYVIWLMVLVAAVLGRGRAARALTGVAVAVSIALVPLASLTGVDRPPLFLLSTLVMFGTIVLAAPVDPLRRAALDRRALLIATAAIAGILAAPPMLSWSTSGMTRPLWYRDLPALQFLGEPAIQLLGESVVAALVTALAVSLLCLRLNRRLPLAITVLAYPWAVFVYGTLAESPGLAPVPAAAMCAAGLGAFGLAVATVSAVCRAGRRGALRTGDTE